MDSGDVLSESHSVYYVISYNLYGVDDLLSDDLQTLAFSGARVQSFSRFICAATLTRHYTNPL